MTVRDPHLPHRLGKAPGPAPGALPCPRAHARGVAIAADPGTVVVRPVGPTDRTDNQTMAIDLAPDLDSPTNHPTPTSQVPRGARRRVLRPEVRRLVTMTGYAVRDALRSLRRNPGLAAATAVTVALAVTLAGAGVLVRDAVDRTAARWADGVEFVVYLDPAATDSDVARVRDTLSSSQQVQALYRVTQQEAFEEFTELYSSEKAVIDAVTPDLLPSSFRVSPTSADPKTINAAVEPLRGDPAVYEIVTADDAVRDVRDLSDTASTASGVLTVVLGAVALVLCTAMIRTTVATRSDEIRAMRLIGASRSYVAAPLVLEGALCGLAAAAVSTAALLAAASAARSSSSRVITALIPTDATATTTAVLATAAAATLAVAAVSTAVATVALWRAR